MPGKEGGGEAASCFHRDGQPEAILPMGSVEVTRRSSRLSEWMIMVNPDEYRHH
jgi:hypothetical protein